MQNKALKDACQTLVTLHAPPPPYPAHLQLRVVYADAATAQFQTIENKVIWTVCKMMAMTSTIHEMKSKGWRRTVE